MIRRCFLVAIAFAVTSCSARDSADCCIGDASTRSAVFGDDTRSRPQLSETNGADCPDGDAATIGTMTFVPALTKPALPRSAQSSASARVMIVSFDGLRPDAISAETAPTLQGLIDGGSYQPAALAEIPAVTLPNHTSMLTGLSILSHGVVFNFNAEGRVVHPTIFDVAREHGVTTGFFVNKGKLGYLCVEGDADVRRIKGDVDVIADECATAIRDNDLRLIFLHFGEPDGAGHAHGWMSEPYIAQVTRADAALKRVLDALNDRDLRDETLLIVTADHGGHGNTHGFPIPEDQHVPFILNGPGIAEGRLLTTTAHPMDVAATALAELGLPATIARDGRVIDEARVDFEQEGADSEGMSLMFSGICGPMPWFFMSATLVCARRLRGTFLRRC